MPQVIESETPPLVVDGDGVTRVRGSRVTLDTVVGAFWDGATVEEIGIKYPTRVLAGIYAVIGDYLHHRDEVDAYLREAERQAAEVRAEIDRRSNGTNIRERLLARQAA